MVKYKVHNLEKKVTKQPYGGDANIVKKRVHSHAFKEAYAVAQEKKKTDSHQNVESAYFSKVEYGCFLFPSVIFFIILFFIFHPLININYFAIKHFLKKKTT